VQAIPADLKFVYSLNPLVGMLEGFRWSLISGSHLPVGAAIYSTVFAIVSFLFGALLFTRMERKFADVV